MHSVAATSLSKDQSNINLRQGAQHKQIERLFRALKDDEIDRISKVVVVDKAGIELRRKHRHPSSDDKNDEKSVKEKKANKNKKHKHSKKKSKQLKEETRQKIEIKINEDEIDEKQVIVTEKPKKMPKPKVSKPKQKVKQETINEIQRQFSRISRKKKRKSNFYLDKIDCLKWGIPVGRGSKRSLQKQQKQKQVSLIGNQRSLSEQKRRHRSATTSIKPKTKKVKKQIIEIADSEHENEGPSDRNLKIQKGAQKNINLLDQKQSRNQSNLSRIDRKSQISEKSSKKGNKKSQKVQSNQ